MSEINICIYTHAHSFCLEASWAAAIFEDLLLTDRCGDSSTGTQRCWITEDCQGSQLKYPPISCCHSITQVSA